MNEEKLIGLFYPDDDSSKLDDCSLIQSTPAKYQIHTTDFISENTHFKLKWSTPADIANKLLQSNLSDILASAGIADFVFLNLGLPNQLDDKFINNFANTLNHSLKKYNISLKGGDTWRSEIITAGLHLIGHPGWQNYPKGIVRSTGQPGTYLYLTGALGRSLAGLRILNNSLIIKNSKLKQECINFHKSPVSRMDLSDEIFHYKNIAAMMDISDGLFTDIIKLAKASRISIHLDLDSIPIFPGLEKYFSTKEAACSGEEYELLFLAAEKSSFPDSTMIGKAEKFDKKYLYTYQGGKEIHNLPESFYHFK